MKKLILVMGIMFSLNANADINTSAISTPPDNCKVDHRCDIHGSHDISIINESLQTKNYYYIYKLCIVREGMETDCSFSASNVVIEAGQKWNNHFDSIIQPRFSYATTYRYVITTQVVGNEKRLSEMSYQVKVTN
jgi:hypothetical protein